MCQPSVSSWSSWPCGGDEWQDLGRNGIAQVAVGLLIVIVLRALGELLHIDVCGATGFTSPSKLYATWGDGSGSSGSGRLRTTCHGSGPCRHWGNGSQHPGADGLQDH